MTRNTFDPSRRRLFRQGVALAGGVVVAGLMSKTNVSAQSTKVAQAVAKYQSTPKGGQQCDGCLQFIPGKTASADGTCKIVEGSIAPKGWCMFFAPKG